MKRSKFLLLLPLVVGIAACDGAPIGGDEGNSFNANLNNFNIKDYNADNALEAFKELGDLGVEIELKFTAKQDAFSLVGEELEETHEELVEVYTAGVKDDAYWCYQKTNPGKEDETYYGIAIANEEVYTFDAEHGWDFYNEEDDEVLYEIFNEFEDTLAVDDRAYNYVLKDGEGPRNVTVAGRPCAKFTFSLVNGNRSYVASISFDAALMIPLATSIVETYGTDTSSTTTTETLEVTAFRLGVSAPDFPNPFEN